MKLLLILGFVLFAMDPCQVRPKPVSFAEVNDHCRSDHPTKYTKLRGKLLDRGDVICGDMPGGNHCEMFFGDGSADSSIVRVLLKGGKAVEGATPRGRILYKTESDNEGTKPVTVRFDSVSVFDMNGVKINIPDEKFEISGTLSWDEQTQQCTQRNIQLIERVK